jgi:phenylacetate-CoA ligase
VQARRTELLARPVPRRLYYRSTSGSTGKPLRIGADPDAAAWAWANDHRGLLWHGIRLGARSLTLRPRTESALAEWIRNRKAVSASEMSLAHLSDAVRFLQSHRTTYVWGYTSAVVELARHARLHAPDARRPLVPFAKLFGEMVHPFQRQEIVDGLGARVIETYGCNETGTVAYECPVGSLHVFIEHVLLEVLRDGEPVPPGDAGDIVLTCLTNKVMPLIRYRVEDRGRLSPDPCPCGRPHPVIADIEGRLGDLFVTTSGVRVHGTSALGTILKKALDGASPTAVGRVLFEQHNPTRWKVLVQAGPGFTQHIGDALASGIKNTFGDCLVEVELVSEIPREPSGKFRFYRAARESLEA